MRLIFSVLWFDDDEEYFDSLDIESLKKQISSWGFIPDIDMVSSPEEFNKHSPFEKYDLIVVDRNLEGYEDGQEFIIKIRDHAVYTEIIFYTAGNTRDLWEAIREKELEGVFVSSRSNILSKIARVGYQSIGKILDLENMRGIVMAEVGELDLLLEEIIAIGIESLQAEQQSSIFTKFYKNAAKQNQDHAKSLAAFIERPEITNMLALCDSDKRWQNFNRLWKSHEKLKEREKTGDYIVEVLRPRNFLAHGKSESHKDGGYIFHFHEKEYLFDNNISLELRQTILRYKNAFTEIIKLISDTSNSGA
jgi:CheY-like chemotaxis protein